MKIILAAVAVALVVAATASASISDPRKCARNTPGGDTRHAYWCAHDAAVATVRTVMARREHVARWYSPTFCDQAGTLLRWRCTTIRGGDTWKGTVTFRATSTGWHVNTAIVAT